MDAEGGALIMGGAADYKPLTWSPKDMEFQALRRHVREAVLAASGVPPSRVSLPTANYAQAKEMEALVDEIEAEEEAQNTPRPAPRARTGRVSRGKNARRAHAKALQNFQARRVED